MQEEKQEKQQGFRADRFTWDDEAVKYWEWLVPADKEETTESEDTTICQGPFWPSPDDENTGYCTCCQQEYYGNLQSHPCVGADDEIPEEGGE